MASSKKTPVELKKGHLPFTIGADPEFTMTLGGIPLSAVSVLQKLYGDDCPKWVDMGIKTPHGVLGHDGASSTAEIRPKPSDSPRGLVENIEGIMREFYKVTEGEANAITASVSAPTGGHIHIALSKEQKKEWETNQYRGENVANPKALPIITRTLALFGPLLRNDSAETLLRRGPQGSYGDLGNFRVQDVAEGVTTLEVRAPSAEWLTTPKIAEATLAYVACVWHESVNHPRTFSRYLKDALPKSSVGLHAIQTLMVEQPHLFNAFCTKVKAAIRHFEMYPEYKELIDYILTPEAVLRDKQAVSYDILRGWNLTKDTPTLTLDASAFVEAHKKPSTPVFQKLMDCATSSRDSSLLRANNEDVALPDVLALIGKACMKAKYNPTIPVYLFGLDKSHGDAPVVLRCMRPKGKGLPKVSRVDGRESVKAELTARIAAKLPQVFLTAHESYAFGIPRAWREKTPSLDGGELSGIADILRTYFAITKGVYTSKIGIHIRRPRSSGPCDRYGRTKSEARHLPTDWLRFVPTTESEAIAFRSAAERNGIMLGRTQMAAMERLIESEENCDDGCDFDNGRCVRCSYRCDHDSGFEEGTCNTCNAECPHSGTETTEQDGSVTCDDCGATLLVATLPTANVVLN